MEELLKWVFCFMVPQEIITDQGMNFMLGTPKAVCHVLGIKHLQMSVYHPQTNGLVEQLNGTIKR